jgi:oligopeptide transport system ATP-binding protein
MNGKDAYIEVEGLKKYFVLSRKEILKAVDDISFSIDKGQTMGLVGESGCGKSTTGRCLVGIHTPTDGHVYIDGEDMSCLGRKKGKEFCAKVQMVFQNPYSSLNPRMTISDIIGEGIREHNCLSRNERKEKVYHLLHLVGLNKEHADRFPHEFSGGQRQRIGIARALSVDPEFIICDEPISALDVSIQAQVINMLLEFQKSMGLTYLMIAHDLSMVKYVSDTIAVMYLGSIMEYTSSDELYRHPAHPYTKALLSSIPVADPRSQRNRKRILLEGEVPSPVNPPECCKFVARCNYAKRICSERRPPMKEVSDQHFVACHLF